MKRMTLNLGPSHPATHGCLRIVVELDGETIVRADTEIGYLHRAFEKHSEHGTYPQVIPYTDRLNYCSSMANNVGYCMAVEKLLDIEIPERARWLRMIACEIARIIDHLICVGTNVVDLGGLTNFWWFFNVREKFYAIIEDMCGARLTTNFTRIGGVPIDPPGDFAPRVRAALKDLHRAIKDVTGLLVKNRIFIDRTKGIGAVTARDALEWGFTGPCLRASGVAHDLRKAEAYYYYAAVDFDIPVGDYGDTYDRNMVRFEEMRQSARIIEQCLERMPEGPIMVADRRVALPPKQEVYTSIEALMNHFKLTFEGLQPPAGEVYSATEAANGELGFYVISDGSPHPYRVRVRPPCFPIYSFYPRMIEGLMIADAVAILGSLNIVVGELDR